MDRDHTQVAHDSTDQRARDAKDRKAAQLEALTVLVLRRTKLTNQETILFRDKLFAEIFDVHYRDIWGRFGHQGLPSADVDELVQETFETFYTSTVANGFPDSVAGMLHTIAKGKLLNHVHKRNRSPLSIGLPSSSGQPVQSGPHIDSALDLWALAQRVLPQLSAEQRQVVDLVILNGLSHSEAAEVMGASLGSVKALLVKAKERLVELVEPYLTESQRS